MAANISVGSQVWVEDPDVAWVDGEVFLIEGNNAHINTTNGKKVVAEISKIYAKDVEAPPGGVDDMTRLSYLHEPGVLQNLAIRYELNEIYTYTGNILIAINPFQRLPHLYDTHMMDQYKGAPFGELSPHVFAIADAAYRAMMYEGTSNSVLVSGESGAGKTETTKMLMRYLAYMGGRSGTVTEGRTVEQQVLESNPVLEAFGNSKTVRNNNSSRFGKFVELHFDHSGRISGAAVRTYLLERSRVCQINDPERNYHCFYFLCAAPPEDVAKFKVGSPGEYHYLNQSKCLSLDAINDAQEYLDTRRAMEVVGISQEEQDSIFRVVASILHLGNVDFVKEGTDSSSIKDEKAKFHLNTAAELLMCDVKGLESALVSRVMHTPEGIIMRSLDPSAAVVSRDGIAKTIYSRLFDWLVDKINVSIGQDANRKSLIGVLDIYGFESFKTNSFEQLCINFTNEKLQQHFNQHVFKMEQEEYTREEINWSYIDFVDNKDVLDLIEKKPGGVISILDEACMFPKSTHETFAQKLYDTFKKHKRFVKPKLSRTSFTIVHYAGDVTYQADYFMDKNKDFVVPEHNELLNASKCSFVSALFPPLPKESAKSSKFSSIGARFKLQLQALMETLGTTEPRYIRCVKPNNVYKPGVFENMNILNQLRCAGVLEAIRISCAGYPTRKTFDEFIHRFGVLAPEFLEENDEKEICRKILDKKGLVGYQIGKTKVFLRAGQMAELDARRGEVLGKAARIIQRQMRTYMERKEFLVLRKTSIYVQALWRGRLACKLYEQMRREAAAVKIQKFQRRRTLWEAYMNLRMRTITMQTGMRGMAARNEFRFKKRNKAATILQAKWRCHRDYTYYKKLQDATLTYQCAWRQRIARKELKKLTMAAKETGALKEAKDKLEKRVEELTWRLQLEKRQRTDLEEAQARDVAKLKEALDEMKSKLEESNAMVIKEREAAQKAIQEAPPVVKETPVLVQDTEKIDSLTAEIENLKDQLEKEKNSTSAALQTCADLQDKNEKLAKQLEDAGKKVDELQESIQRFEEKLTNLEGENQVLRQQALTLTSVNSMNLAQQPQLQQQQQPQPQPQAQFQPDLQPQQQPQFQQQLQQQLQPQPQPQLQMQPQYQLQPVPQAQPIVIQNAPENGNIIIGAEKPSMVPVAPNVDPESDQNPRKYLDEKKKQENKDMLISCISKDIGFSNGRPIAACVLYKCLLHWGSFEVERTSIFDVIIQTMTSSLGAQDSTDPQFYWLSNSAMLLLLLQRTLKASAAANVSYHRRRTSTSLFGRTSKGTQPSQITGLSPSGRATTGTGGVRQVEAKYPALLFKQQLTGFLERIYGTVRDRMKKEISPLLGLCIQAPRTSRAALVKGARAHHHHSAQAALIAHWQSIVKIFDNYLQKMRDNYVPPFIVREMFKQIFSFINVQLFNSLLLRRECCSFSNGEYVKAGLSEIEFWCSDATDVYTGAAWDELKHIRQAVAFLVTQQKPKKTLKEITEEICPELSIQQLYRISSMYWDDKYGTHTISNEVMRTMKTMVAEDSNPETSSFLLDDDSSIPFSIDDMSRAKTLQPIDITDVEPPPFLVRQNSGFAFLVQHTE